LGRGASIKELCFYLARDFFIYPLSLALSLALSQGERGCTD